MAMHDAEPEPLWVVVEEHLDEAEFLWELWEHSLVAPNYTLDEVAEGPEERLMAHIDGLVVNGPLVARKLLIPALEDDDPGRVSAAATALLLGTQREAGYEAVLEVMRDVPEQRPPLVRALCCVDLPGLLPRVRALLTDVDAGLVAAAAEVLAFHFEPIGEAMGLMLASDDPAVRALALRALPHEPDPRKYVRAVQAGLDELDPRIVDVAIETGVRLGLAPAWARARERCLDPGGGNSMLLLALRGEASDRAMLVNALQDRKRRLAALWALGFLGTPEAVDASLEWLEDTSAGPLAGEVFTAVTGVDLDDNKLSLGPDGAEEALEHRPEDDLPRPNPMAVLQWWMKHRGEFTDGERYLAGEARSSRSLVQSLIHAPMRRRPGLILEMALSGPSTARLQLQPSAPARRQRAA